MGVKREYLFRFERNKLDAVAPVSLETVPTVGEDVYIAGKRYLVKYVDASVTPVVVGIEPPPKKYIERREPKQWT